MKKIIFTLLLMTLSIAVEAQNKDSLAFDNYFKQVQKNFKYIQAIDSISTILKSLQKENNKKEALIEDYKYAAENAIANLKLYNFLIKIERDSLKTINSDTSEYLEKRGNRNKLKLKYDVNLESLQEIIGKNELEKQLPMLLSNIKNGSVEVDVERPDVKSTGNGSGFSLPDWPSFNNPPSYSKIQLEKLYIKQDSLINELCYVIECGWKFRTWFAKKQSALKYPQQIVQLIQNQIAFKIFIENHCSN